MCSFLTPPMQPIRAHRCRRTAAASLRQGKKAKTFRSWKHSRVKLFPLLFFSRQIFVFLNSIFSLSAEEEAPREPTPEPPIQEVNLLHFTPLGGIFYYDLYHLPPQSHIVHGWEIRQVSVYFRYTCSLF